MNKKNGTKLGFITGRKDISGKEPQFSISYIIYDDSTYSCSTHSVIMVRSVLLKLWKQSNQLILLNAKLTSDNKVLWYIPKLGKGHIKDTILDLAKKVRTYMEIVYGTETDLCGTCIEASELLVCVFKFCGYHDCKTVEGWCEYDDDSSCSDRPYDEHTWVEIAGGMVYLDITADQFNTCMYKENKYPPILLHRGLPHGMSYDEPEGWEPEDGWDE